MMKRFVFITLGMLAGAALAQWTVYAPGGIVSAPGGVISSGGLPAPHQIDFQDFTTNGWSSSGVTNWWNTSGWTGAWSKVGIPTAGGFFDPDIPANSPPSLGRFLTLRNFISARMMTGVYSAGVAVVSFGASQRVQNYNSETATFQLQFSTDSFATWATNGTWTVGNTIPVVYPTVTVNRTVSGRLRFYRTTSFADDAGNNTEILIDNVTVTGW